MGQLKNLVTEYCEAQSEWNPDGPARWALADSLLLRIMEGDPEQTRLFWRWVAFRAHVQRRCRRIVDTFGTDPDRARRMAGWLWEAIDYLPAEDNPDWHWRLMGRLLSPTLRTDATGG